MSAKQYVHVSEETNMANLKRVIYLTQWFDPEPTIRGNSFIKKLSDQGFEIEVVTGFPNYPNGVIYPGFKLQPILKLNLEKYQLTRLWLFPNHSKNIILRALNYSSFALSSLVYLVIFAQKFDLIYVYHPPITTVITGALVKILRRSKMVLDIQDLWPDTISSTGMLKNKPVLFLIGLFCQLAYRKADKISVLSSGFRSRLVERGVPFSKIDVIYNWANEYDKNSIEPTTRLKLDKFNILMAGNIGPAQDVDSILATANILLLEQPNIHITLIGGGIDWQSTKEKIKSKNLTNVSIHSQVSADEISNDYEAADALLIHLKHDDLFTITIPSRTQTCLYAGKPVIMCVNGNAADLITDAKAGYVARPGDPRSIASTILQVYKLSDTKRRELGENGHEFYLNHLSMTAATNKLSKLFHKTLGLKQDTK